MADESGKPDESGKHHGIDPRYDPAFQRGYRPDPRRAERSRVERSRTDQRSAGQGSTGSQRGTELPSRASAERAAPERVDELAPAVEPQTPAQPATAQSAVAQNGTDDDFDADELDSLAPMAPAGRTNPYIVALWIIGIGLIVVGVGFLSWAQSNPIRGGYNPIEGVPFEVVLSNLAYTVCGPMITVGLATIVALLFLLAVGRKQRTRHTHLTDSR